MLNLLSKRAVQAKVRFEPFQLETGSRKELAVQLRDAVLKLKNSAAS
jgi:hypothetical protein